MNRLPSETFGNIATVVIVAIAIASAHYSLTKYNSNNDIKNIDQWLSSVLENSRFHHISRLVGNKLSKIESNVFLAFFSVSLSLTYSIIYWSVFGVPEYNTSVDGAVFVVAGVVIISAAYLTGSFIGQLQQIGEGLNDKVTKETNYNGAEILLWGISVAALLASTYITFDSSITVLFLSFFIFLLLIIEIIIKHRSGDIEIM